ncbi:carbohydrate porin [Xylophilus sp. ASV27]|uniref:carbohydrate porin n=1 Tax=Xylophilus sp. ASV27 TaxID=2795129 RepID=UPI0018EB2F5D|nr:carbohydrate porin [Xylophilus sp. ASV27]
MRLTHSPSLPARHGLRIATALLLGLCGTARAAEAAAAEPGPEPWNLHAQATYVWQIKPSFPAAYSGPDSLSPERARSYSFTSTAFMGLRLGPATEAYFNPEVVQGLPLSNLTGLGGPTNGELQKAAGSSPTFYRARLFLRHTWGLGGGTEQVESDANQLAGAYDKRRLTLTAGNFALTDVFDNSLHASDARTQFLNWSFLTHGAYDYAADSRGYTWGAALDYRHGDDWSLRAGRFLQPKQSNGLPLDRRIFSHYGDQVELERRYTVGGREGSLRLLGFHNVAVMAGFDDALAYARQNGGTPELAPVRKRRSKYGAGVHLEQQVADGVGVFLRASANDGRSEPYAFTSIDRAFSAGATFEGARWGRPLDALGLAAAVNGLSSAHRAYLAAGGTDFFVGDGRLRYRTENIFEGYYRIGFGLGRSDAALSFGLQLIHNPGYNADRGPVKIGTVRLHVEI